jgi:hypothetical protein
VHRNANKSKKKTKIKSKQKHSIGEIVERLFVELVTRLVVDLTFFSLTTSETATTADRRLGLATSLDLEAELRRSLRVDPRKEEEEGAVLRGSKKDWCFS